MKQKRSFGICFKHLFLTLSILVLFIGMSGNAFAAADTTSLVRIVHASPDAGPVDVFVDGKAVLKNLAFGTVTSYTAIPSGEHTIKVAPAGKGIKAAVITSSGRIPSGHVYTVAAIGTKEKGLDLQTFADDNSIKEGSAKVRVYHLSPNAGPVDVLVKGKHVITELGYKGASNYLTVPAGSYTFDVHAVRAGVTVPVKATLKKDTITSVFALGLYKGTPSLQFVVSTTTGASS
ncbi:cell wall anchor [Dictyobacter vulcani]|uniref:Cell wall anchor n=1 Tax=Dictyobacter vulcani TaxID=2607529 RepID=A0A5J4KN41_9CHLR|nr:DUF4397 domain-containing protein [Dictyobacter vulcani]GER86606.1 cell wall anchor [Dictyobacter vulcani]